MNEITRKEETVKSVQKDVQNNFGTSFERFCNTENIKLTKLENGSFRVDNYSDFTRCKSTLRSKRNKKYNTTLNCYELDCQKGAFNNIDLTIGYKSVNAVGNPHFQSDHVLQKSRNGYQLLYDILQTDVGVSKNLTPNKNFHKAISAILNKFLTNYKKLNYYCILKNFLDCQKPKSRQENVNENHISHKHVTEFIRLIIHKTVPIELFGSNRNKKKIMKAISDLLIISKWETFSLAKLVNQLDLSSINWLSFHSNEEDRYYVIAKTMKWFFIKYILEILHINFYITYYHGKRIFIRHKDWNWRKNRFIKELKQKLIPDSQERNAANLPGKMVFLPKSSGIRSIVVRKCNLERINFLNKAQSTLQQLYITNFSLGKVPFLQQWHDIVKTYGNSDKPPMMVTADISDAFGSINQVLLFNILQSEFDLLPDRLNFQKYKVLNPNNCTLVDKYCVTNAGLKTNIPPRRICHAETKIESISKNAILNLIRTEIFETKIDIRNKIYNISKGIPQGGKLSPVLSNIYYEHMINKYCSCFKKSGSLSRYVDDIYYVTDQELLAAKFLVMIDRGIGEYNCHFNKNKTKTNCTINLSNIPPCMNINYIGWNINSNSLELAPTYKDARASMSLIRPKNNQSIFSAFQFRLMNFTPLKLPSVVLNGDINSISKILTIVKHSCLRLASRCFALLLSLFDSPQIIVNKIALVIERCNIRIVNTIWKRCTSSKLKDTKLMKPFLHYILWKSYLQVFRKKTAIYNMFYSLFKQKLSKLNCLKFRKQYNKLL